jgi:hypothetical protein
MDKESAFDFKDAVASDGGSTTTRPGGGPPMARHVSSRFICHLPACVQGRCPAV